MIDQIIQRLFGRKPSGNLLKETKALAGAIPLIAQAMVDRRGHKVRLIRRGSTGGCTDGTTIQIEDTPIPRDRDDIEQFVRYTALQLGLVHHEVGHVNHTDFTATRSKDRLTGFLENLIEDVRQEMVHITCVRNGRDALDAMGLVLDHVPSPDPILEPQTPVEHAFTGWILRTLRFTVRGEGHLQVPAATARWVIEQRLGVQAVDDTERLMAKVRYLANTQQAIALAGEMVKVLHDYHQQLQQPQPQQQQQGQGQGQQGNPPPQQQGQGQPTDSASSAQDSQPPSGDASTANAPATAPANSSNAGTDAQDSQGNTPAPPIDSTNGSSMPQATPDTSSSTVPSNGSGAAGGGSVSDADRQSFAQAMAELLAAQGLDGTGDRADTVQAAMQALSEALVDHGAVLAPFDPDVLKAALQPTDSIRVSSRIDVEAGVSVVQRVRSVLNKHLQAQSMAKNSRSDRGSKLVTKALVRVPMGDARLFAKHHSAVLKDTAIVIAMDCSGSMNTPNTKIVLADQAVYATACALETLPGCHLAVTTFPYNQMVLRFGQRARKHRRAFGQMASGGTPMHEAVQMATAMLVQRKEPRKLLLVVTDGEPDCATSAQMALLAAERFGIETMAIGIMTTVSRELFPRNAVVHDLDGLSAAMLQMLGDRMVSVREAA